GDARLAEKWQLLTGKFIYQRACTSCYTWGPAYWPRSQWKEYLKAFPGNHQPDVVERYKDLTAMFDAGKMVPTLKQEGDALTRLKTSTRNCWPFTLSAAKREPSQRSNATASRSRWPTTIACTS